jgi:hypothetical protein
LADFFLLEVLPFEYTLQQLQNVVKVAKSYLDDNWKGRPSMKEVLIAFYNFEFKDVSSFDFNFEVWYYYPFLLQRTMLLLLWQSHMFLMEEQCTRDPSFLSSWLVFLWEFPMDCVHHNIFKKKSSAMSFQPPSRF